MLAASARLHKSKQISAAMKSGKRSTSKLLVIFVAKGDSIDTKVAFAVGKTVGNSVVRHKVTRRLRHILSQELPHFPPGCHVVVRALPGSANASFDQLKENLEFALRKVAK